MDNKQIKVLAIDDIPDNLTTLRALVKEAFPESIILTATNGIHGIAIAREEDPDVILLDIVMPDMDGFAVCQALKADEIAQDIPVVFLTALKSDKENRIRALEAGAEGFLNKPIDESELSAQIRAMAKIKTSHIRQRYEKQRLETLVQSRTQKLSDELELRKQAEKDIIKSKDRYARLFNSNNDMIFLHKVTEDKLGTFIEFNDTACIKLGYTSEELLKLTPIDISEKGTKPEQKLLETGQGIFQRVFVTKSGEKIPVEISSRLFIEDNQTYSLSIARDISDRKKHEENLQLSDSIVQNVQIGLHIYQLENPDDDRSLRMVFANPASAGFTGIAVADVVGKTLDENFPGLRAKGIPQKYASVVHTGKAIVLEDIYYNDERVIDAAFSVKVFALPGNKVGVSFENITRRKKIENELLESEGQFRSLFENALNGIGIHEMVFDADGKPVDYIFRSLNKAFEKHTGLVAADTLNKRVTQVHPDITKSHLIETYGAVARTGVPAVFDLFFEPLDRHFVVNAYQTKPGFFAAVFEDISERKKAEAELTFRTLLLSLQQEASIDGILVVDETGKIISYNQRFVEMWMIPPAVAESRSDELALQSVIDMLVEPELFLQKVRYLYENRRETSRDEVLLKNSRTFELYTAPIFGKDDTYYGRIWFFRDITERKQAIEQVRQSEDKFSRAFQTSPYAITITRVSDGKFIEVNDAFTSMSGITRENALASTSLTMNLWVNEADRNFVINELQSGRSVISREFFFRTKDSSIITGLFSAHLIKLNNEACILASINDITERLKAQRALQENEQKQSVMIANISDVISIVGTDGIIKYKSPNITKWFGWDPQELVGANSLQNLHPDDLERIQRELLELFKKDNSIVSIDCRYKCKDGSFKPIQLTATNLINNPAIGGILLNYHDITERQQFEERLRQSEKMEAIGQLAGGIAHDFNNILGGIIGYTDMALDAAEKESKQKGYLQKVLAAADRAKNLVTQILTFSRQSDSKKAVVSLVPVVKEVLELLKASFPSSVILKSELGINIKPVRADSTKIHELILNLATNAVYAMKQKGTLTIRYFTTLVDQEMSGRIGVIAPGEYSVIEIGDTGCGMDTYTLEKAFEPFFTTKPVGEGTGMGLSVVLGVVQLHEGDLQVESIPSVGTTFRIFLPASNELEEIASTDSTSDKKTGMELILFVDDEEPLVEMAKDSLSALGYRVTGLTDSRQALEFIKKNSMEIDMLITDQTMPHISGIELAKEINNIRKNLPIILCTGFSNQVNSTSAAYAGISRVALKPLRIRELADMVREVLDQSRILNQ